jgi:hypothetical protein
MEAAIEGRDSVAPLVALHVRRPERIWQAPVLPLGGRLLRGGSNLLRAHNIDKDFGFATTLSLFGLRYESSHRSEGRDCQFREIERESKPDKFFALRNFIFSFELRDV